MPASRRESKAIHVHRRDNSSNYSDDGADINDCTTFTTGNGVFTEEQLKLRAMIPAITPAHGPASTATVILATLEPNAANKPNSHTRRKSDGHVNRPPNAFIIFRRAQVQNMPANVTQHQQRISNLTALFWRVLTHSEQKTWFSLADDIKKLHAIMYPDYNFNPRNPDGSKKPMLPQTDVSEERRALANQEAQYLIAVHTTMIEHPVAPPASTSGKFQRPKAPRKGQGTRAKERREKEAAERAAAAVAATARNAAACDRDELVYSTNHLSSGVFENQAYFATIEEEVPTSPSSDTPIAWRPDFTLEGSVSSRSSPSNTWSEFSTAESGSEFIDPLDTGYAVSYEQVPVNRPAVVENYHYGTYVAPYNSYAPGHQSQLAAVTHELSDLSVAPPPIAQKREDAFNSVPKYATIATEGPVTTFVSYYEPHGTLSAPATMAPLEMAPHQVEAQYVFHDIDPTATYLQSVDAYTATGYGW